MLPTKPHPSLARANVVELSRAPHELLLKSAGSNATCMDKTWNLI